MSRRADYFCGKLRFEGWLGSVAAGR